MGPIQRIAIALACLSWVFVGFTGCCPKGTAIKDTANKTTSVKKSKPKVVKPAPPAPATTTKEGLCPVKSDDRSTWPACTGKKVQLVGKNGIPQQHPIASIPGTRAIQTYLQVAGGTQVVLATRAPPQCNDKAITIGARLIVTGFLKRVDLGGRPDTRKGYGGWSMIAPTIVCK
jgi:hypothetical protein